MRSKSFQLTAMLALIVCSVMPLSVLAAENYAGDFLMLGAGARALGMGSAALTVTEDATASYHNPAGLVGLQNREINLMHSEQFAGLINYNTVSFAMPVDRNLALGVTLLHSGIGNIKYTRLLDPSQPMNENNRPVVDSLENAADYTVYASAARTWRGDVQFGATVKLIRRTIADDAAFGYGIDLGLRYTLQERWILGAVIRDATGTAVAWDGKANDRIAPTLDAGIATTGSLPLFGGTYILASSIVFFGDSPDTKGIDTMNIGGEYLIGDYLAFRAGSHQGTGTFGVGIMRLPLLSSTGFDYAFLADDGLDSTHRVSMTVRF